MRSPTAVDRFTAAGIAVLIVIAAFISPPTVAADPIETTAVVLKVVDGDTIDIRDDIRGRLRIRVLGIDTPETKKPGYTVGCWGPQATQFAQDTLLGQRVAFLADPTQDRTDRYGRTLAYLVKGDGWNYSVEAARAGTAHAYIYDNNPVQKYAEIAAAEQEAKAAGRGLWGPPCHGNTESTPISAPQSAPSTAVPDAGVYFPNCKAAKAAGAAPLYVGQPGYRTGLDGDGDGVACE
jgi:micrococcal nuclease